MAAPRWVDKPAWPANGKSLELTWLVHPPDPDLMKAPVELLATIAGTTRRMKLSPQLGKLICHKKKRGEVAKLTFSEAGVGGFIVRRASDVLTVVEWQQPDADPRRADKVLVRLHIPKGVKIHENTFELDADAARRAFNCSG